MVDLGGDRTVDGPNQLWVADFTYVASVICRASQAAVVLEGRRALQSGMASKFGHWLPSPENLQYNASLGKPLVCLRLITHQRASYWVK